MSSWPPAGQGDGALAADRLREVLEAVIALGSRFDLPSLLARLVEEAAGLVGARYAALGVVQDQRLVEFITYGITAEQREAIGTGPRGLGLLGLLVDNPRPIRLENMGEHPLAVGFPPHHPPMHSLLGVPVPGPDRALGNLYLTDKLDGTPFTAEDQQLVVTLAAAAAVAVRNAQLYAESERHLAWLEAAADVGQALLSRIDITDALRLVAHRARTGMSGDVAAVVLEDDAGQLVVEAVDGAGLEVGQVLDREGLLERVIESGRPATDDAAPKWLGQDERAQTVAVPFTGPGGADGVLVVVAPGDPILGQLPVDASMVELVRSFAVQAALALDRAQAQADRELLAVLADRDRIARDLHDMVIQRLFATGLMLQGAARMASPYEVVTRLKAGIADLDATIADIRATIFELHQGTGSNDIRVAIREVVQAATAVLGFAPSLVIEGPVATAVSDRLRPHLLAVLRETLSNAARHAAAGSVQVLVTARDGWVIVRVVDDGRGIASARRSGLGNLSDRANALGGTLVVEPGGVGQGEASDGRTRGPGTRITWRAPISA